MELHRKWNPLTPFWYTVHKIALAVLAVTVAGFVTWFAETGYALFDYGEPIWKTIAMKTFCSVLVVASWLLAGLFLEHLWLSYLKHK